MSINRNSQNWWMLKLLVEDIQKELDKPLGEADALVMTRHLVSIRDYSTNMIFARKHYIEDVRKTLGIPDLHEDEYELIKDIKWGK